MAAQTTNDVGGLFRPQGRLDAAVALAPSNRTLDAREAAHLLRRAGFGGTPEEIARYTGMQAAAAAQAMVRLPSAEGIAPPADVYSPMAVLQQYGPQGLRQLGDAQTKALYKSIREDEQKSVQSIQLWWLNRMLQSRAPLQEKMTLLYHGHFTSAVVIKGISPQMIYNQMQLFRSSALGNLRELTRNVSKDPAMLRYLDGTSNVAGHPNENYARELMELFTLGVDHYTEDDVRESARAWTGWRFNRFTEQVTFAPRFHDDGTKTFLGRTGNFNGDDIVDIIFQQPQCARFFAGWLLNNFVYNDPEPELIDGVAQLLRRHDYELTPVMAALLSSNVFYSQRTYRALVKSPVEFVVGAHKALGLPEIPALALPALRRMGQVLFYPPNVAGWPGGQNWLTSSSIIQRQNYLARIVNSQSIERSSWLRDVPMKTRAATGALVSAILQGDAAPASTFQLEGLLGGAGSSALAALSPENYGERISGAAYLAMSTPAFQLA